MLYNAHLFGRTAEFFSGATRRETPFYFQDHHRLPIITEALRRSDADFVGLNEVWDGEMAERLRTDLREVYPYTVTTPAAGGLGGLLSKTSSRWPRLAAPLMERAEDIVGVFTRRHYGVGKTSLARANSDSEIEDLIGASLQGLLRSGPIWGSGLLFLSRYPILGHRFHEHPVKADWERLAQKGILEISVQLPEGEELHVSLGHYQEGTSKAAALARRRQIQVAAGLLRENKPTLALGDFNIPAQTLEYEWMLSTLTLYDPGSPNTYEDPNPFQNKLTTLPENHRLSRRLDYILHNDHLRPVSVKIPRDDFRDPQNGLDASDHLPVQMEFERAYG